MNSGIDQSNLTAYALGELTGTERAAVAAQLVNDAAARRYVADVRAAAALLSDELARESYGGLTDLQHAAIEQQIRSAMRIAPRRPHPSHRSDRWVLAMSLAASIVIVGGVMTALLPFVYRHVLTAFDNHAADVAGGPVVVPANPSRPSPATIEVTPAPMVAMQNTPAQEPLDLVDQPDGSAGQGFSLPPPDDRLALSGSGREETAPLETVPQSPAPMPGISHADVVRPVPSIRTTQTGSANAGGVAVQAAPPTAPSRSPGSRGHDEFASLDQDQRARNRENSTSRSAGDAYAHLLENPFVDAAREPVSGFSAGVDTASYSNVRRFLTHGKLPPTGAVRIEEMLNYFPVRPLPSTGDGPLAATVEVGACPWKPERRLARVCVQARELSPVSRPPVNLVFVVDVSESMRSEKTKLPLIKQAMHQVIGKLSGRDRVAIVAYSNEAGVVLASTPADDKQVLRAAIDRLDTGGHSEGGQGIEVAYDLAARAFIRGGVNRVVLATDGNWNVGVTQQSQLSRIVQDQSRQGVSLTVLGVGMSNLKDDTLQKLAAAGAGSYAYIDTLAEARKVLSDQVNGALVAMARDVKVQVSLNPSAAESYRLIGYERRLLSREELSSQSRHGGEMGAGQSVTALYEVIPTTSVSGIRSADLLTAVITYADPITGAARSLTAVGEDHATPLPRTSTDFRFAAAVAEFGLVLRDSDYKGNATYANVIDRLQQAAGPDESGYRQEFAKLVKVAKSLAGNARQ